MKNISNYSQPSFYTFSEVSVHLAEFASSLISKRGSVLDLCSGCGIIGIETKLRSELVESLSFLELQKDFLPHIKRNLEDAELTASITLNSLGEETFSGEKFDYILSNPPYFSPGDGLISPDIKKQICRTFEADGWKVFFKKVEEWLAEDGLFFLSTRSLNSISIYLEKFRVVKQVEENNCVLICLARLNKN